MIIAIIIICIVISIMLELDIGAVEKHKAWRKKMSFGDDTLDPANERGSSIRHLQELVVNWADRQFPDRTANETLAKLVLEEIPELAKTPTADEFADVMILVLDLGHLLKIDLEEAVRQKMIINKGRNWKKDLKAGYWRHI